LVEKITQALQSQPESIGWDFEGCYLNACMLKELAPLFNHLCYLNIANNHLGRRGAHILAEQLLTPLTTTLLILDIGHCHLCTRGVLLIAEALHHNTRLASLDVHENSMRMDGARGIATMLRHNTTLEKMNIGANNLGGQAIECVLRALTEGPSALKELQCYDNTLGLRGAQAFAHFLQHTRTPFALNISNCRFGSAGEALLYMALQQTRCHFPWLSTSANTLWPVLLTPQNHNVAMLHLDNIEHMPDTAFQELPPILTSLFLRDLTAAQGLHLCATLLRNTTLTHLVLGESCILTDIQGVALACMLQVNTTLLCLQATQNVFTSVTAHRFADALRVNRTLKELRLFQNRFNKDGAIAIAQALQHNQSLVILSIRGGDYFIFDVQDAFSQMLTHNTTLRELYMDTGGTADWYEEDVPIPPMVLALKHNRTLHVLDIMEEDSLLFTEAQEQEGQGYLLRNKVLYLNETWHPSRHATFATPLQELIFVMLLLPYRSAVWARLPTELIYMIAGHLRRRDSRRYPHWELLSDEHQVY
jgi:Ran GTPase-activating protein (RanGAP) involved in mRNA processing and transport